MSPRVFYSHQKNKTLKQHLDNHGVGQTLCWTDPNQKPCISLQASEADSPSSRGVKSHPHLHQVSKKT